MGNVHSEQPGVITPLPCQPCARSVPGTTGIYSTWALPPPAPHRLSSSRSSFGKASAAWAACRWARPLPSVGALGLILTDFPAWSQSQRGAGEAVLVQLGMEMLAGCAAHSAAALRMPRTRTHTCGCSQLSSGFSLQHCHSHIFYYELIPNLLLEKDQTSPYVFVGCLLCLL